MKSVSDSLKDYVDRVWTYFSDSVGSFAYNSAKKLPPSLKLSALDPANVYEQDLKNELITDRSRVWKETMKKVKRGEITPERFDFLVRNEFSFLETQYLENLKNIPATMESISKELGLEELFEPEDKPGQSSSSANYAGADPFSLLFGKYSPILMVNPTKSGEVGYGGKILKDAGKAIANGVLQFSNFLYRPLYKHRKEIAVAAPLLFLGAVADSKFNNGNNVKKVVKFAEDPVKGLGGAASFVGSLGDMLKPNQAPIIEDFNVIGNLTAGSPIDVKFNAYDTDGIITGTQLQVDGNVTPTPVKLSAGSHTFSLKVTDDDGKSSVASKTIKVEKQTRNDIKVILGSTRNTETRENSHLAKYLNETGIPSENIRVLNENLTFDRFVNTLNNAGMSASDDDTLLIYIGSDAGKGNFAFNKEGVKYNMLDGKTQDYRSYKMIAEAIRANTNPNADKLLVIDGCYSGSAINPIKEVGISNIAVVTSTTDDTISGGHVLDMVLTNPFIPHKDFNGDGKITFKELYESYKEDIRGTTGYWIGPNIEKNQPINKSIPQIWDPQGITDKDELVLVD